ncbi:MAG: sulfatase-like hydrolase/transferase [bacterium]|nr:sulfatase-like hydrolase/transferase [bacterium]
MGNSPNIIYIVADQFRGDCLGVEQSRHPVMTPHLDQIGWEGARFTRAYADCPICMPQRATMLTGQSASRFGVTTNFMGVTDRTPIEPSHGLPGRLTREAGYQTKAIGKMHFNPQRARFGFEHVSLHPDDYIIWLAEHGMGGLFRGHGLGGNEVYPTTSVVPEQFTHTRWITDEAIRFLRQRDPDCPFFLWMIYEAPHSPFDPPAPYDRLYDNITIPEPAMGDWAAKENIPQHFQELCVTQKYDYLRQEHISEVRRRYYGQISEVDYNLGRLFGALKTQGLYDDTLLVFTSDHGEHLGDHGVFHKHTFLESSARVPLLWKLPQTMAAEGSIVCDMPALTADITPTIFGLVGLKAPEDIDGISLLPTIKGGEASSSHSMPSRIVCGETPNSVFATDGHFKYIYYFLGGIEHLFNVSNDLDDLYNLAERAECRDTLLTLKQALIAYFEQFDRPCVQNGKFVTIEREFDKSVLRTKNPMAWRGPLRYGQGY